MSTTASTQSDLQDYLGEFECDHCGAPRSPETSVRGSFCSADCFYRHKGANVLAKIRDDHRLCATCFRQIKEVESPPAWKVATLGEEISQAVTGTQYPTPDATEAVDDFSEDPYRTLERSRIACRCGNVDPSERDDILEDVEIETIVPQLLQTLHTLEREGQLAHRPDKGRLFAALREHWRDWAFAIGRALYE